MTPASTAYLNSRRAAPFTTYVRRSTRSENPNHRRRWRLNQGAPSRRPRLLQLLLAHVHRSEEHVGRDLLVHVEFLPVGAAPVGQRVQHGRVLVELRLGNEGLHLR